MHFTFFKAVFRALGFTLLAITGALAQGNNLGSLDGRVVDATTQQPVVGAAISFEAIKEGQPLQQQKIGPTGAFRFTLLPGNGYYVQTEYYIRTEAAGYLPTKEKFIVSSGYATHISGKTIYLTRGVVPPPSVAAKPVRPESVTTNPLSPPTSQSPLAGGLPAVATAQRKATVTPPVIAPTASSASPASTTPAVARVQSLAAPAPPVTAKSVQTQLQTMQFVQSRAELVPESQPALDQLLTYMRENPGITIELAGHTDNQGNFEENLTLSRQRVELVKAYLVKNGIAASRIASRGYGSTRPISSNNSEATRRLNRRVEMTILTK